MRLSKAHTWSHQLKGAIRQCIMWRWHYENKQQGPQCKGEGHYERYKAYCHTMRIWSSIHSTCFTLMFFLLCSRGFGILFIHMYTIVICARIFIHYDVVLQTPPPPQLIVSQSYLPYVHNSCLVEEVRLDFFCLWSFFEARCLYSYAEKQMPNNC